MQIRTDREFIANLGDQIEKYTEKRIKIDEEMAQMEITIEALNIKVDKVTKEIADKEEAKKAKKRS
jgi:predicted RNase H-like nuclease (RuvC/YqgF family)